MKIYLYILFSFILFNANAQIDSLLIKQHVAALSHDSMMGREFGGRHIKKSSDYIIQYFRSLKLKSYFETYEHTFEKNGESGNNVVAYIEGKDKKLKNELIIISAHYDHIGMRAPDENGDSIINGANDNAAGTALVLELANYFSKQKLSRRSILFVALTGEEKGLFGSAALVTTLKNKNSVPYLNFNLEMMGTVLTNAPGKVYMTGFNMSNLSQTMNAAAGDTFVQYSKAEEDEHLFFRSDNFSFYDAFKIPAHSFSTFDFTNFDYYHQLDDETEHLNYSNMSLIGNNLAKAILSIANAKIKVKLNEL
jgi:Zn-dependent M28 family amino/carboxypeptidase